MEQASPLLTIIHDDSGRVFANNLANAMGYTHANIVIGGCTDAVEWMKSNDYTPLYLFIDIGDNGKEGFIPQLQELSQHCFSETQVVVAGNQNDIEFYRALINEGVTDYFTNPVTIDAVRQALTKAGAVQKGKNSNIISFISAAAGDGSSTAALNVAYSMAHEYNLPTVLIDMDYQFGMVSKNLDLSAPFGIKEFFEHPDRGIDKTLVERMVVPYKNNLYIIAAPHDLRFMPKVPPEVIRDLLTALSDSYKCILLDLPHAWTPWVSAALTQSTQTVLVGQLWLKSVTHASRLLNVWRDIGMSMENIVTVINRSGAKFKEAVAVNDFERVCNKKIDAYLVNDIKTVVHAENQGKTILELGNSKLSKQIHQLTEMLLPEDGSGSARSYIDSNETKLSLMANTGLKRLT